MFCLLHCRTLLRLALGHTISSSGSLARGQCPRARPMLQSSPPTKGMDFGWPSKRQLTCNGSARSRACVGATPRP
ncbi:hypothetical protein BC826DRAFT_1041629 [Russula brevipes]|nr:hypothetical protein BC826DRAFT_1041629 [Russula brevipes]